MLWIYGFRACESVHRMSWGNNQDGHVEEGNEEPADTRPTARQVQAREIQRPLLLPVAPACEPRLFFNWCRFKSRARVITLAS